MPDLLSFQRDFVHSMAATGHQPSPMLVYRNTSLLGAIEALRDNFPVTCDIVGERVFDGLVTAFVQRHAPAEPVLALYGEHFPDWLAGQEIAAELPYLADVARCERMWIESMHAADAPRLELHHLQLDNPDALLALRLRLHPAARFAWQTSPAVEIWQAHQDGFDGELEPEWRAVGALFTRPELDVAGFAITAACHRLLFGVRLGETLGVAAGAAARIYPQTDIGQCFAQLVQAGAFANTTPERTTQ